MFQDHIKKALTLELSYPYRLPSPRDSDRKASVGVLCSLPASLQASSVFDLNFWLMKRTDHPLDPHHSGQISFPGGMVDPRDLNEVETSKREYWEEMGFSLKDHTEHLGNLPSLYTLSSQIWIVPTLWYSEHPLREGSFHPSKDEVDLVFCASGHSLQKSYRAEKFKTSYGEMHTDVFYIDGHRIWGATGSILKNLLDRFQKLE